MLGLAVDMTGRRMAYRLTHGGYQADTEPGKEAACQEHGNGRGSGVQHDTQVEDPRGYDQAQASADGVCQERGGESTKEGAGGENGHDGGLLRGGDVGVPFGIDVTRAKEPLPVGHSQDSTDGTSIVSAEGGQLARNGPYETDFGE